MYATLGGTTVVTLAVGTFAEQHQCTELRHVTVRTIVATLAQEAERLETLRSHDCILMLPLAIIVILIVRFFVLSLSRRSAYRSTGACLPRATLARLESTPATRE